MRLCATEDYKIRASGYLGYHIRPDDMLLNTPIGSQLVYGGGIAYHPVDFVEFLIEYTGKPVRMEPPESCLVA